MYSLSNCLSRTDLGKERRRWAIFSRQNGFPKRFLPGNHLRNNFRQKWFYDSLIHILSDFNGVVMGYTTHGHRLASITTTRKFRKSRAPVLLNPPHPRVSSLT